MTARPIPATPAARRGRALRILLVVLAAIVAIPVAIGWMVLGMGEGRR